MRPLNKYVKQVDHLATTPILINTCFLYPKLYRLLVTIVYRVAYLYVFVLQYMDCHLLYVYVYVL